MHPLMPRLAAILAVATIAQTPAAAEVSTSNGVTIHRGSDGGHGDGRGDHRRHRHDHDRFGGIVAENGLDPNARTDVLMETYGGEWALYNNRSWQPDSYNDWWHDNPQRSFPRWVTSGMCERQWYSADTLRC